MSCLVCKVDFCWVCMSVIGMNGDGVTEHYQNSRCEQFEVTFDEIRFDPNDPLLSIERTIVYCAGLLFFIPASILSFASCITTIALMTVWSKEEEGSSSTEQGILEELKFLLHESLKKDELDSYVSASPARI